MSETVLDERWADLDKAAAGSANDDELGASCEIRTAVAGGQRDEESRGPRQNGAAWPFFI